VAAFGSVYEDLISYEYYPPFLARAFNFATAAVYGVEAAGEASLPLGAGATASASAAYTLLFSRNLRDEPRYFLKELPFRPRHTLRAQLTAGPEWLVGRLELRAQSEQFLNRTEEGRLPARALVHASVEAALPFARAVRLTAQVKNVFDVQAHDVDGYPLPGRAFYAGVRAELGDRSPERSSQEQAR
jgi:iron complex outermembrane receptor protein